MAGINRLTVSQLRVLCKEKGLSGYSKLTKGALLEKLSVIDAPSSSVTVATTRTQAAFSQDTALNTAPDGIPSNPSSFEQPNSQDNAFPPFHRANGEPPTHSSTGPPPESSTSTSSTHLTIPSSIQKSNKKRSYVSNEPQKVKKKRKTIATLATESPTFKVPQLPDRISQSLPQNTLSTNPSVSRDNNSSDTLMLPGSARTSDGHSHAIPSENLFHDNTSSLLQDAHINKRSSSSVGSGSQSYPVPHASASPENKDHDSNGPSTSLRIISNDVSPTIKYTSSIIHTRNLPSLQQDNSQKPKPVSKTPSSVNRVSTFVRPRIGPVTKKIETTVLSKPHEDIIPPAPKQITIPSSVESVMIAGLQVISLPPSLAQRRQLPRLSLAFGNLDSSSCYACTLVSRAFRYAVYLSALDILKRDFGGKRLSLLLCNLQAKNINPNMTNFWPYLRARHREKEINRTLFDKTWVAAFFRHIVSGFPVTPRMWESPDDSRQLEIIARFLQTRTSFALSPLLSDSRTISDWATSTVIDTQEVIPEEIWSITVIAANLNKPPVNKTYYILFQTCEVIGHPESSQNNQPHEDSSRIPLRVDWSSYIALRLPPATRHLYPSLLSYVRSMDTDNFERGISKAWLKRVIAEGEIGKAKLTVAERYVMCSVVGNSISGTYKTAADMALEFAGVPGAPTGARHREKKSTAPRIELFLPERHNVESVHFTTSKGCPLHSDLALIQIAGREEGTFVLRNTGIPIGENQEIPAVWMRLLSCDGNGIELCP